MAGPDLLVFDTDCLLQVFMAEAVDLLALCRTHGMSPIVVPEVEIEVTSNRKFGREFEAPFRKACGGGLIQVVDASNFAELLRQHPNAQSNAAGVSYADIQALGAQFHLRVDLGEAYTHAMALSLGQPAASNDASALRTLSNAGHNLPSPVLRMFDLVTFAYHVGNRSDKECDAIRRALLSRREGLPKSWQHAGFTKGLQSFKPRLLKAGVAPVGAPTNPGLTKDFNTVLLI